MKTLKFAAQIAAMTLLVGVLLPLGSDIYWAITGLIGICRG